MALPNSPALGTKYKFGTLRVNGAVQANPTKPWRPDSEPVTGKGVGNIPQYGSGAIAVGDSDAAAANQINWVYVAKDKYIADRNILCGASWNVLNTNGFVTGVTTTIDGVKVKISLISGGVKDRSSGTTGYAGGTPTNNEWDQYIQNEAGVSGLPVASAADKDSSLVAADFTSTNGAFWNWAGEYTWCKEVYEPAASLRVLRGYGAASYLSISTASDTGAGCGFRPVLEVLNSAPLISDPTVDQNLGNKTQGFTLPFTISDPDGDKFSILAKLNATTLINTSNNSNGTFSLAVTGTTWSGLALGTHTITITSTDTQSAASTRTVTFTKTNTAPTAPVITGLSAGQRVGASGSVSFNLATDADGDTLTYTLQFANDSAFTSDVKQFTGSASPIAFSGLATNANRFVRVVASDGKATTPSGAVQVKIGNVLEFKSNPINRATHPVLCRVLMDWTAAEGATHTLFVCNNANDADPTWENCTSAFNAGTPYAFTNNSKVNSSWAVGLRVVINAGTATGTIEVRAFGFDITVS